MQMNPQNNSQELVFDMLINITTMEERLKTTAVRSQKAVSDYYKSSEQILPFEFAKQNSPADRRR